jgi:hypothetical protein
MAQVVAWRESGLSRHAAGRDGDHLVQCPKKSHPLIRKERGIHLAHDA